MTGSSYKLTLLSAVFPTEFCETMVGGPLDISYIFCSMPLWHWACLQDDTLHNPVLDIVSGYCQITLSCQHCPCVSGDGNFVGWRQNLTEGGGCFSVHFLMQSLFGGMALCIQALEMQSHGISLFHRQFSWAEYLWLSFWSCDIQT